MGAKITDDSPCFEPIDVSGITSEANSGIIQDRLDWYRSQLDWCRKQLEVKDRQISQLYKMLEMSQKSQFIERVFNVAGNKHFFTKDELDRKWQQMTDGSAWCIPGAEFPK